MRRLRVSRPEVRARACSEQFRSGFTLGSASEYTNPGKNLVNRQSASQIAKLCNAVLQAPLLQGIDQRFTGAWVPEIHRADLDGGCAGQQEFNHIFSGADAADDAELSALADLIEAVPTTLSGIIASMKYIDSLADGGYGRIEDDLIVSLLANLAGALEELAVTS